MSQISRWVRCLAIAVWRGWFPTSSQLESAQRKTAERARGLPDSRRAAEEFHWMATNLELESVASLDRSPH